MEEASLQVEAGDGGGPISVFTSSGLLSILKGGEITAAKINYITQTAQNLTNDWTLFRWNAKQKWDWLDFLGLCGFLHVLEALWRAQLESAAVVHVPNRLQQDAYFGNPGTDRKGHCTGMIEGVIPQTHLKEEPSHLFTSPLTLTAQILLTKIQRWCWSQSGREGTWTFSYLCSHSDVGYGGDASAGLWLFVLGSGLLKHLLSLTKRHNTPTKKSKKQPVKFLFTCKLFSLH